jgi:LAGLIDADG DNA endonuclease family.
LAFLIFRSGEEKLSGLNLCTNNYSISDVVRLINVLIIKYDLNCSIR